MPCTVHISSASSIAGITLHPSRKTESDMYVGPCFLIVDGGISVSAVRFVFYTSSRYARRWEHLTLEVGGQHGEMHHDLSQPHGVQEILTRLFNSRSANNQLRRIRFYPLRSPDLGELTESTELAPTVFGNTPSGP